MPVDNNVPDSTDWLSTPLSGLAAVEAALRCQVCKDFYRTPMITSCSHTFCSLCIRRALSNDGRCPLCRAPEQELKLRSNWTVEEAVDAFSNARPAALDVARQALSARASPKRKAADDQESPERHSKRSPERHSKRLRTSARLNKDRTEATSTPRPSQPAEDIVEVSDDDQEYLPDDPDGHVPCPVCEKKMKAWQVFQHLETCPGPPSRGQGSRRSNTMLSPSDQAQRRQDKSLERLPALNYSMLKEQALRKKMVELGISNQGPRSLLEKRHKEWMTLWNANCDSAQPKKRSELLLDLEIWERTQGGRAPTTGRMVQAAAVIKDKDFDGAAWAARHESSFKDLIASARKSKTEAKRGAEQGSSRPPALDQTDVGTTVSYTRPSSPFSASRYEDGMPAGMAGPQLNLKGPETAHSSACSITMDASAESTKGPGSQPIEPTLDTLEAANTRQEGKQRGNSLEWDTLQPSKPLHQHTAHLDPDG